MNIGTVLLLAVIFLAQIGYQYLFRYQRTTLGIARLINHYPISQCQALMTPTWMGIGGWLSTLIVIVITLVIFYFSRWYMALAYVVYVFVGGAIADSILPFPTYNHIFNQILKSLNKDLQARSNDPIAILELENLKENVLAIKASHLKDF